MKKADRIRVEVIIFKQYNVYIQKQLYMEQIISLITYLVNTLLTDIYSPILETR
jgi:hypothetical protein